MRLREFTPGSAQIDDLLSKKKYEAMEVKLAEAEGHGLPLNKAKRALQLHHVLHSIGDTCLQAS